MSAAEGDTPGAVGAADRAQGAEVSAEIVAQTPCADQDPVREKLLATYRAKLALAGGHVLLELADGSYLVTRWGLSRALPDLAAVAMFVQRVVGPC